MTEKQLHIKDTIQTIDGLITKITDQCNTLKCNTEIPMDLQIIILKIHNAVSDLDRNSISCLKKAIAELK